MLLKNCLAFIDDKFVKTDILIKGKKIVKIQKNIKEKDENIIDCKNNLVSAGFIDIHQHWREPGYSHKETILSASLSSACGGITCAGLMPNTKPVIDNLQNLELLEDLLKQSVIKSLPYAAISVGQKGEELVNLKDFKNRIFAFSDDGRGLKSNALMLKAMQEAKELNIPIISHCEELDLVNNGHCHDGKVSKRLNIAGISSESESVQVARDLLLANKTACKYHICHMSAKESVHLLRLFKSLGANVSGEVSAHHLVSCEDDILNDDGNYKMNPPLRAKEDKNELLKGLNDGTIEIIATDHAPHAKNEKEGGFNKAYFGIIGSSFAFSLLYTKLVLKKKTKLKTILNAFSVNVKKRFNLKQCGELKEGSFADICVIDLNKEWILSEDKIPSLSKNTPYLGEKLYSKVILTIVDGKIVYKENE